MPWLARSKNKTTSSSSGRWNLGYKGGGGVVTCASVCVPEVWGTRALRFSTRLCPRPNSLIGCRGPSPLRRRQRLFAPPALLAAGPYYGVLLLLLRTTQPSAVSAHHPTFRRLRPVYLVALAVWLRRTCLTSTSARI